MHDHTDRELLLLILQNQETQMAQTTALSAAVAGLTTVVGEVVTDLNSNDDQAAIDAATSAIETAITDLKGALPKPAAPVVDSLNPNSGPEGTSVAIVGTGFTGATTVTFGSTDSTFTVDSDTQITATSPAGSGGVPVVVVGPGGSSTPVEYTY